MTFSKYNYIISYMDKNIIFDLIKIDKQISILDKEINDELNKIENIKNIVLKKELQINKINKMFETINEKKIISKNSEQTKENIEFYIFLFNKENEYKKLIIKVQNEYKQLLKEQTNIEISAQKNIKKITAKKDKFIEKRNKYKISNQLLNIYNKLIYRYKNLDVIAELNERVCGGCKMILPLQLNNEILTDINNENFIAQCPFCNRLLYSDKQLESNNI